MKSKHSESNGSTNFLVGAVAGGLIGTVAALLLAPKKGEELRQDLHNGYHEVDDKLHCLLNDNKSKKETHPKDFVWGGILGGVAGACAGLLLAPKSGQALRKELREKCDQIGDISEQLADVVSEKSKTIANSVSSQAREWADKAKDVIHQVEEEGEELQSGVGNVAQHINEALKWVELGTKIWQNVKKGR